MAHIHHKWHGTEESSQIRMNLAIRNMDPHRSVDAVEIDNLNAHAHEGPLPYNYEPKRNQRDHESS